MDVPPIIEQLEFRRANWMKLIKKQIKNHGGIHRMTLDELGYYDGRLLAELSKFVLPDEPEILNDD